MPPITEIPALLHGHRHSISRTFVDTHASYFTLYIIWTSVRSNKPGSLWSMILCEAGDLFVGNLSLISPPKAMDTFHNFTRIPSSDSGLPPAVYNYIGTTATNSLVCHSSAINSIASQKAISNLENTANNALETKETPPPGARELLFTLLCHYPILASLCPELHASDLANFVLASRTLRDTIEGTLGGGPIGGKTARWTCGGPDMERFRCWRCNRTCCKVCTLHPRAKAAYLAMRRARNGG